MIGAHQAIRFELYDLPSLPRLVVPTVYMVDEMSTLRYDCQTSALIVIDFHFINLLLLAILQSLRACRVSLRQLSCSCL
jgi:hypothetical protein